MKITPPMTAKGMYFFIKACLLRALAFFWYFFDSYDSVLDILVTSREDQTQVSPEIPDISRGRDLREGERERFAVVELTLELFPLPKDFLYVFSHNALNLVQLRVQFGQVSLRPSVQVKLAGLLNELVCESESAEGGRVSSSVAGARESKGARAAAECEVSPPPSGAGVANERWKRGEDGISLTKFDERVRARNRFYLAMVQTCEFPEELVEVLVG